MSGAAPQLAPDVAAVPLYADVARRHGMRIGSYIGFPIRHADGELFGVLCGVDGEPRADGLERHRPLLDLLTGLLSSILEAERRLSRQGGELELARRRAQTDALTGLYNRRGWHDVASVIEAGMQRFADPAIVVAIDLDGLKAINDVHGHETGDAYLRRAGGALHRTMRGADVVARMGGDEFAVLAVETPPSALDRLLERLTEALDGVHVAASIGAAVVDLTTDLETGLRTADRAMYEHKRERHRTLALGERVAS